MVEGGFKVEQKSFIELIESSRHRRFLNMVSTAIDQAEHSTLSSISLSLSNLFASANSWQKRLMLQITESFSERAIWLRNLSSKEMVAIVGAGDDKLGLLDYELIEMFTPEQ